MERRWKKDVGQIEEGRHEDTYQKIGKVDEGEGSAGDLVERDSRKDN
jgi:hypothetical protein